LWREVTLISNGVQPEYVKRRGYLTASCKAKLKELDDRRAARPAHACSVHYVSSPLHGFHPRVDGLNA